MGEAPRHNPNDPFDLFCPDCDATCECGDGVKLCRACGYGETPWPYFPQGRARHPLPSAPPAAEAS
jgi:hypothetical protein